MNSSTKHLYCILYTFFNLQMYIMQTYTQSKQINKLYTEPHTQESQTQNIDIHKTYTQVGTRTYTYTHTHTFAITQSVTLPVSMTSFNNPPPPLSLAERASARLSQSLTTTARPIWHISLLYHFLKQQSEQTAFSAVPSTFPTARRPRTPAKRHDESTESGHQGQQSVEAFVCSLSTLGPTEV